MQFLMVAVMLGALVALVRLNFDDTLGAKVLPYLVVGFIGRLVVHVVVLRSDLLNYGGDCLGYEDTAHMVVAIWRSDGISFITDADMPILRTVAVPINAFAMIEFICGDPAPIACTAFVALIAAGLCIVIFRFAKLIGADDTSATRLLLLSYFGPSFVIHTSDMYKDGINAFLVVTALYVAVQVARKVSILKLVAIVPLLWCLWHVRPYMVFMCALPLALAVVGFRRALSVWGVSLLLLALVGGLIVSGGEEKTPAAIALAEEQFERGSSVTTREDNAQGGSGVTFDDGGSAWGSLGPKVIYTLFSPFPWSSGSITFQLGKLETMLWYYLLFCSLRALPWFWKNDRESLLLIALFVIPSTLAYATSMSNVGLIFRQRMPITIMTSLLAAVYWTRGSKRELAPAPALGTSA